MPPPPELPPAIMPPMNPATADLTRVSMLVARRGGASVGRCAAPRLPFPGLPPSSAVLDRRLTRRRGRGGRRGGRGAEEESRGRLKLHSLEFGAGAGGEDGQSSDAVSTIPATPPWRGIDNSSARVNAEIHSRLSGHVTRPWMRTVKKTTRR